MKTITVPANIQLTNPTTGSPLEWVTFKRWFIETVLADQRMGISPAKLARVMTMMGKVTVAEVGSTLELEDADYDACKAVITEPQLSLGAPIVAAQMLAFPQSFLAAESKG